MSEKKKRVLTEPVELPKNEVNKFKVKEDHEEGPGSSNEPTPQDASQQNTPEHAQEVAGVSTDRTLYKVKKKSGNEVKSCRSTGLIDSEVQAYVKKLVLDTLVKSRIIPAPGEEAPMPPAKTFEQIMTDAQHEQHPHLREIAMSFLQKPKPQVANQCILCGWYNVNGTGT